MNWYEINSNLESNIRLRSEEAQEILSKQPPTVIRWGSTIFLLILSLLLAISWVVRYPDIVSVPFRLTSANVPKAIHAKINGKLVKLLVKDNQIVQANTALAFLESTARHEEVLALEGKLQGIKSQTFGKFDSSNVALLGELQPAYQTYQTAYRQYLSFLSGGFYAQKEKLLQKELADLQLLASNYENQKNLHIKDLALAQSEFGIQQKLFHEKVISSLEFKREESKFLAKRMPLQQIDNVLINNISAQTSKQKEILELQKMISEQESIFVQAKNTLMSAIQDWKMKYLLTSTTAGKVYFSSFLQENQNLSAGQEVFFVATKTEQEFGEVNISQYNFGKVKRGQKVFIKFNAYPFSEFGMVEGKIDFISEIPLKDSVFLGKILLPKGLITNYGKKLTYKVGMTAQAEIITEDSRLIERFFYNIRKAITR
jgi:HlyD family secretion protein